MMTTTRSPKGKSAMKTFTEAELRSAVKADRLSSYARLRGGFPIPLAGAVYWAALGAAGYFVDFQTWSLIAFFASGAIFPLALFFSAIFKNDFMKDRTSVGSVLIPAFISMLLFWAFIVAAMRDAQSMIPLLLAVGMSIHWPVIGWTYARTALYSAHAIARAVATLLLWLLFPEERLTWLPLSVSAIYLVTVVIIICDSGNVRTRLALGATRP